jgi:GntR family transcriptional regulator/MocR family aminotransferase
VDAFPFDTWTRLVARRLRTRPSQLLCSGDRGGYWPLREAIAHYLGTARAVHCRPEQIIVCSGSLRALDLATRVLLDDGDAVWIEDPGYFGARSIIRGAGVRLIPVPVDNEGLDVAAGVARCPGGRMAYVTPSHQYPLGMTMFVGAVPSARISTASYRRRF